MSTGYQPSLRARFDGLLIEQHDIVQPVAFAEAREQVQMCWPLANWEGRLTCADQLGDDLLVKNARARRPVTRRRVIRIE